MLSIQGRQKSLNDVVADLGDIDLIWLRLFCRLFNKSEELVQIAAIVPQSMGRDIFSLPPDRRCSGQTIRGVLVSLEFQFATSNGINKSGLKKVRRETACDEKTDCVPGRIEKE